MTFTPREIASDKENESKELTLRDLFDAGVHLGHPVKRWNPKIRPYIFTRRSKMHVIDITKTLEGLLAAKKFITDLVVKGGEVLFVGTKIQARNLIREEATRCMSMYVNYRWLGGTLTNFHTIEERIKRLIYLEDAISKNAHVAEAETKRETLKLHSKVDRLNRHFAGIREITSLPDALFIQDAAHDYIAVTEAHKLNIPIVAVVDTNSDPTNITYPIPGNDDSMRAIKLLTSQIADAVLAGKLIYNEDRKVKETEDLVLAEMEEQARSKVQLAAAERQHSLNQNTNDTHEETAEVVASSSEQPADGNEFMSTSATEEVSEPTTEEAENPNAPVNESADTTT